MSDDNDAWADSYDLDAMEPCLCCGSKTRSHVLLLHYNQAEDRIEALDPSGEVAALHVGDAYGAVCHSCYEDHDGDAQSVATAYDERVDALLTESEGLSSRSKARLANGLIDVDVELSDGT